MAAWPKKYNRPALIIFSTNANIGSTDYNSGADLILTDHGRSDLSVSPERIESAGRMVDGTYRSHFINEKLEFNLSWSDVPSRNVDGGGAIFTADGYAAGRDIIEYVEDRSSTFYVKFAFDPGILVLGDSVANNAPQAVYKVYVGSYSYSVTKRGPLFDTMDIDLTLVEV
jgi:hypothetical protein